MPYKERLVNKKWMKSWKKYCLDYEIIEWNEDNYDVTKNEYMYEVYQPAFAGIEVLHLVALGLGFGAEKGNEFIRDLRDLYNDWHFIVDRELNITDAIPYLQKEFFAVAGYRNNGDYQVIKNMIIYPEKVLGAKCGYTGRIVPTENTFMIHHYDASWVSSEKRDGIQRSRELFEGISYL